MIWVIEDFQLNGKDIVWLAWGLTLFAGLTMVTNIPYYSGKEFNLHKKFLFRGIAVAALCFCTGSKPPTSSIVWIVLLYAFSGYGIKIWRLVKTESVAIHKERMDCISCMRNYKQFILLQ